MKRFTKWMILILTMNFMAQVTVPIFAEEDRSAQVGQQSVQNVVNENSLLEVSTEITSTETTTSEAEDSQKRNEVNDEEATEETSEETSEEEIYERVNIDLSDWIIMDSSVTSSTEAIEGRIDIHRILEVMAQYDLTEASWKGLLETSIYKDQVVQLRSGDGEVLGESKPDSFSRLQFSVIDIKETKSIIFVMNDIKLTYQADNVVKEVVISPISTEVAVQQVFEDKLHEETSQNNEPVSTIDMNKVDNVHAVTSSSIDITFSEDWLTIDEIDPATNKITGQLKFEQIHLTLNEVWENYKWASMLKKPVEAAIRSKLTLFLDDNKSSIPIEFVNNIDGDFGNQSFSIDIPELSSVTTITLGFGEYSGQGNSIIELKDMGTAYFTFPNIVKDVPKSDQGGLSLTVTEDSIDFGSISLSFANSSEYVDLMIENKPYEVTIEDTRDSINWTLSLKRDPQLKSALDPKNNLNYKLKLGVQEITMEYTEITSSQERNSEEAITRIDFGAGTEPNFSIQIENSQNAIEGAYSTNLHWELSDTK